MSANGSDVEFVDSKRGRGSIRLLLHRPRFGERLLNFAHVATHHSDDMPVVPSDDDCIPTRFGDDLDVSEITLQI
jgi:hypothetical protein